MTTAQVIFERAVKHHLPTVFVTQLEKVDEFELGQVLLYHHKKWWQVFQKKELDYTGVPLETILVQGESNSQFKVETEKTELFSATSDQSTRNVDVDLDLDAEVKVAFIDLGGKVDGKGSKKVTLSGALGAVNHIRSNVFQALYGKGYTADLNHPVVKDAMARGSSIFVISSIYISDKAEIKISQNESINAETKDGENTTDQSTAASTTTTTGTADTSANTAGATDTTTGATDTTTGATATSTGTTDTSAATSTVDGIINEVEDVIKKDVNEKGDAQVGGDVATTGITVTNRDTPTVIGFNVLKIDLTKAGVLMPTDKSGFTSHHKVHYPFADTFFTPSTTNKDDGATKETSNEENKASPKEADNKDTTQDTTPKEEGKKDKDASTPPKEENKEEDGATPNEAENKEESPKKESPKEGSPKEENKEKGEATAESEEQ